MGSFLLISPEQHFSEELKEAMLRLKIKSHPQIETYLVHMLKHYLDSRNLFAPFQNETTEKQPETLAEIYLIALNSDSPKNKEMMKILADRALYLSGFFGDSLHKKMIDVDYYVDMGSAAYSNLSIWSREDNLSSIYKTFSKRFTEYVDVLNYMSEKSSLKADDNVLSLYEKYLKTGSEMARHKLQELGVVVPKEQLKINKA